MKSVTVGTVTNVGGLGDDAYYSTVKTANSTITTLNVKKGGTAVVIRVSGGKKPAEEYALNGLYLQVAAPTITPTIPADSTAPPTTFVP